jgi:hypothetical protein
LRSMLDVHRAANNQMLLNETSIGLLHDIFEPVASLPSCTIATQTVNCFWTVARI